MAEYHRTCTKCKKTWTAKSSIAGHVCEKCRVKARNKELSEQRSLKRVTFKTLRNQSAELRAQKCVEILRVAPELVSDEMWDDLCLLFGSEFIP